MQPIAANKDDFWGIFLVKKWPFSSAKKRDFERPNLAKHPLKGFVSNVKECYVPVW